MSERTEHGFRTGAIEAIAMAEYSGRGYVRVQVGDTVVDVQATPKGRKVYVTIEEGGADLQMSLRRRDGRWEQPR